MTFWLGVQILSNPQTAEQDAQEERGKKPPRLLASALGCKKECEHVAPTPNDQPWATGPREILQHAISLLDDDTDTNRRLAMILIDNAVEQMLKTYLGLPKRITGITISRKRRDEIAESFPALLDAIEEFGADKLEGIDVGSIEWYHRLRNELYHQGFGLTVARDQVEIYTELANLLFTNLFGTSLLPTPVIAEANLFSRFISLWNRLEHGLYETADAHSLTDHGRSRSVLDVVQFLQNVEIVNNYDARDIHRLRQLRNAVVHSQVDFREAITLREIERLEELEARFSGFDPSL